MATPGKLQENYSDMAKSECLANILSWCQIRGFCLQSVSQAIYGNWGLCYSNSVGNGFAFTLWRLIIGVPFIRKPLMGAFSEGREE